MNKTKRFIIVLVVLAVAFAFLFPSLQWYAMTPKEDQTLALGSREQIREYAWRMARADLAEIERLVAASDAEPLPDRFDPLVKRAKKIYKELGIDAPAVWSAKAFLGAFDNRGDALAELEDYYRSHVLGLKKLHGSAVQLGLDLSGGMSVIIRADIEALEAKVGRALSPAERDDAVERALEVLNNRIDKFGLTEPVIRRQGEITPERLTYGDLTLTPSKGVLRCKERALMLSAKELEIMRLLMLNQNTILSKETLLVKVWGYDSDAGDNNVEAYISFLRKKLQLLRSTVSLGVVRRLGYRLEETTP